jgi:hypothetical protein
MPKLCRRKPNRFQPANIQDVFALYLARELGDSVRVRWYARLTRSYSMCLLIVALRRARANVAGERVSPEAFLRTLGDLMVEGVAR